MATQFIGLHMRVVLREPPGYRLTGTVRDVEAGSSLTLTNVYIIATRERAAQMKIDAADIADLAEIPFEQASPAKYSSPASELPLAYQAPSQAQLQQQQQAFVDPAILSVGRRPDSIPPSAAASVLQDKSDNIGNPRPLQGSRNSELNISDSLQGVTRGQSNSAGDQTPTGPETPSQKKKSRSKHHKQSKADSASAHHGKEGNGSNAGGHGKGWRQTPILQSSSSFQPFNSLKKNGKGRKGLVDNGWASEDVTEEMGDFDFENNLAKFDKRTIFDQIRKEDEVDDAERLVSHNRRPKPGTSGGKNFHYTEMVLDEQPALGKQSADFWNSEADVGVNETERLSGREARNGAAPSAKPRAESRSGPSRRSQSRKASGVITSQPLSRVNSSVRLSQSPSRRTTPKIGHRGGADSNPQQRIDQPGLYLIPSNRRLETISTLQMLNLENIAANELGFSESLMAENAGRGIAEVAVNALSEPAIKVRFELALSGSSADGSPSLRTSTIVILAGNNKSGIRALAAARHLRNKSFDVLVCLVGIEREKDLLEDLRRQIQLYRAFGGKVTSKYDFFEHLRKSSSATPVSISLIIDALLGLTISFEELRIGDQATVYELMEWANRNEAFVLSVDVPTGIDPTSGKIAVIDGAHLYVKPRYVVAIGAPKKGLLEAVTPPSDGEPGVPSHTASEDEWRLFIADIGLGSAVWRKAGTKIRKGIDFDGKWVLEMRYRGTSVEYDEE
ncbi:enhancer of mRNA decapping [Conoideocrella luteorostrata]|uniref:Enhancer of mRNA-decapping protein 3 n=1 Tax=Conoideocrella luteorostrata TaxID=1105319 RepID=A0AAJ0FY84_9HYPO|nr:enhancer of mRNA decapping [Conoideocrella luteorostrata]